MKNVEKNACISFKRRNQPTISQIVLFLLHSFNVKLRNTNSKAYKPAWLRCQGDVTASGVTLQTSGLFCCQYFLIQHWSAGIFDCKSLKKKQTQKPSSWVSALRFSSCAKLQSFLVLSEILEIDDGNSVWIVENRERTVMWHAYAKMSKKSKVWDWNWMDIKVSQHWSVWLEHQRLIYYVLMTYSLSLMTSMHHFI